MAGKALKELDIPDGIVFVSIQRKKKSLVPEGHTVLKSKDKVWAVSTPESYHIFEGWLKDNYLEATQSFKL